MTFNETINTGTTPGDGKGSGLRTNMRKLIENDNYLKQQVEDLNGNTPGVVSSNNVTVLTPLDAIKSLGGSSSVGSIKITLPQLWTATMIKIFIEVYDFETNESFSFIVAGYNMNSEYKWQKTSVQIIASSSSKNYTVRFGNNATNSCIYLGELNTTWSYLKVSVLKGMFCHNNITPEKWLTGWNISLETTAFENVTQTHTNNLPVAQ
ncbi:hypothetical protein [Tenacibaculum singaporense]|uniref:hypothetical protein n=1 Tax=Tenacibaculum singaporense TaxID=2358479 RepID=UPI000F673FF7|nr:hypothetical protein [Tenacibaculum singaporense]RSC96059.1 hypothetical protein EI424_02760 [Tenacibaculum singaporense]